MAQEPEKQPEECLYAQKNNDGTMTVFNGYYETLGEYPTQEAAEEKGYKFGEWFTDFGGFEMNELGWEGGN